MAAIGLYIIFIVIITKSIDNYVIDANHYFSTTQAPDSQPIPNPIEGFGDFHYPLDPEDIKRKQEEEDNRHELDPIHQHFDKTNINKSLDNNSGYSSESDKNGDKIMDDLENSNITKFHIGFDGEKHFEEEEGCYCRDDRSQHRSEMHALEIFCRCSGESVTQIPSNLTLGLTRL
jgi:hypothetical protein